MDGSGSPGTGNTRIPGNPWSYRTPSTSYPGPAGPSHTLDIKYMYICKG